MKQNYFIVDRKIYYTGTVFVVNDAGHQAEATFICYDTDRDRYIYKIKGRPGRNPCICHETTNDFWRKFIAITNKMDADAHMPITKTMKDREIDKLFIGWIWYIFLMLISVIFKNAIVLWILFSVVFFSWRSKKIKEEGTYIEW